MHRPSCGFSLIELLAALAIVAILAALAVPAYGHYAYRARRIEGKALLLRIAHAQERYYATYSRYGELAELGFSVPARSEHGYYLARLNLETGASVQSFLATAQPKLAQEGDRCGTLGLDDTGRKVPLASDAWANANGACW
ncbi:type IV pilin protein [Dyella sp. 2RAB6]|uniref:type IV pilin protein n=1 Tax=Dyella sp. 2RAB6 TaxID=3232992 RepID=UPI003F914DB9